MRDFSKRTHVSHNWFKTICEMHFSDVVHLPEFSYVQHGNSIYVYFYGAFSAFRFRSPWILSEVIDYCSDLYG